MSFKALASVSSFLGLDEQNNVIDNWKHLVEQKAKHGQVGFVISPVRSETKQGLLQRGELSDEGNNDGLVTEVCLRLSQIILACDVDRAKMRSIFEEIDKYRTKVTSNDNTRDTAVDPEYLSISLQSGLPSSESGKRSRLEKEMAIRRLKNEKKQILESMEENNRRLDELLQEFRGRLQIHVDPGEVCVRGQQVLFEQHTPWFTYTVCLFQVFVFCVICAIGGVTTIGLQPQLQIRSGITTLLGVETKEHWHIPNIWIGPSRHKMIALGAVYGPCMRLDKKIEYLYLMKYQPTIDQQLGCCESAAAGAAATTYEKECFNMSAGAGKWLEGVLCSKRPNTTVVRHKLWPCCYGYLGQCQLTTAEHCTFLEGLYHGGRAEHCSQVNCLSSVCGFGGLKCSTDRPYSPDRPGQAYRLVLSLFYHHGFVHLLLVVTLQFIVARPIEMTCGWLRMALLYVIPGYLGLLAGAVMSPYTPHVGGSGGLFGLLAVTLVEVLLSWWWLASPWFEVVKLSGVFLLLFLGGTLPAVDNFTSIGGFLAGLLCGVVLLPYVTFGRRSDVGVRRAVIAVCGPLLAVYAGFLFYGFYVHQKFADVCRWCRYVNCLPYAESVCRLLELW